MNHSNMSFWDRVRWDIRRLYHQGRKVVLRRRIGDRWQEEGGFAQRRYPDYGTYVAHQRTKFSAFRSKSIIGHDRRFFDGFRLKDGAEAFSFEVPWPGVQYVLNRTPGPGGRTLRDHQENQRS